MDNILIMTNKNIAVVGAGVGGLATACRLAKDGFTVSVFEKLPHCGGRANILEDKGFKFDMGPSFVLMPDFFEEIFTACGEQISDYLNLKVLEENYKIFFPDDTVLTVHKDSQKTKQELDGFEPGASKAFDRFINDVGDIYKALKPLLYQCLTKKDLGKVSNWALLKKINPWQSYWQVAEKYFKSDKLKFAFTFEAMFMGVSPYQAPGFYSIITYLDHVQKIAHPLGGMYQIPLALEKMARKFGVKFFYNSEVESIDNKGSLGLKLNGQKLNFDKVVVNADYAYTQSKLLKRKSKNYRYSCSVYLIYLGLKKEIPQLAHHNLFFAKDLKANLKAIFDQGQMSKDFSFYIHVPTVTDKSLALPGKSILYILVPVPNLKIAKDTDQQLEERINQEIYDQINKKFSIRLEDLIEVEHKFYPQDFIRRYNINYGATFGLAHNLLQSAFFRPYNFDKKIKNLYYVGASTQPGGGLPVVIASSKIVRDLIVANSR